MTAAKVMDIISRLPGCDGQAADAVSAYTQVKMEDAPKLLKIPKLECPDIWIRLPRHKWPKSWSSMEDPVVPLERKQRSWFGRTNIIPWSCTPGVHSKTMWNKQRYCGQSKNHVWIQNFRRSNGKTTMLGKSEYLFMVLWRGRSCQEMCGTILWVSKQDDSTTLQKYQLIALMTITSKRKNWNPWENCQKCALKIF